MSIRRRLRRSSGGIWSLSARVGSAASFAAVNILLARLISPGDFGTVAVATSVAILGAYVVSAGMNRTLLRDLAAASALGEPERVRSDVRAARSLLLRTAPVGFVATAVVAGVFVSGSEGAIAIGGLAAMLAVIGGLVLLLADALRGLGEKRLSNLAAGRSGGALVMAPYALLLLVAGRQTMTVTAVLMLNVAAGVIALVCLFGVATRWVRGALSGAAPDRVATGRTARTLWVASIAFGVTQIAGYLSTQVDLWIGDWLLAPADVGVYAAALKIMTIVSLPLFAAQLSVIATISGLHATGQRQAMEATVRRSAAMATALSGLILLPCLFAPSWIMTTLFGDEYAAGGTVLLILGLAQMVNTVTGLCGTVLSMTGDERLVLWATVVGAALSAGADVIGAAAGGMVGLAIASATTTSLLFVALWVLARTRTGIWTHPGWPSPVPTAVG